MSRLLTLILPLLALTARPAAADPAAPPATAPAPAPTAVASPDGRIVATVSVDGGKPTWRVTLAGRPLLETGAVGLELGRDTFREPFVLERADRASGDSVWHPVWGNRSAVRDRYNEVAVTLREARDGGRRYQVVLRAYDEGVALRYVVPQQPGVDGVTVKRRLTEFVVGAGRPVYQNRNYEYGTVAPETMSTSEGAVTVDVGDGRFVALTDADRADFPCAAWERSKTRPGTIVGALRSEAAGPLPLRTSWEAVIVGEGAGRLYENRHLVENLCPPCAIADTSWINAGAAICQVRNTRMVTGELKKLMDFASAHRFAHVEIDHSWCGAETKWTPAEVAFFEANHSTFWADKPEWRRNVGGDPTAPAKGWVPFRPKADSGGNFVDLDVADLAAYGKALNPPVGVCLYLRAAVVKEFGGEHPAAAVFDVYRRWGVAGIKLGFVPNGAQQWERAIADVVAKAADRRLIVNIHDAYLPAGLSRTYPNLVNVEGVAGEEAEHSIPPDMKSRHDVMLPFTRCLMGPVDYTPEMFNRGKTHAHQVAMLAVYHGRPSVRGGMKQWSPGGEGGSELEFASRLPSLLDEMRVTTDLGKSVVVARRRGETWYVAGMCDGQARAVDLKLDFLKPGVAYTATVWADVPGGRGTKRSSAAVDSKTSLTIAMEPNGGHLMIVEPAGK